MTVQEKYTVAISHRIYPQECVDQAIHEYELYCRITVRSLTAEETILELSALSPHTAQAEHVYDEFFNYLLDLSMRTQLRRLS